LKRKIHHEKVLTEPAKGKTSPFKKMATSRRPYP